MLTVAELISILKQYPDNALVLSLDEENDLIYHLKKEDVWYFEQDNAVHIF